MDFLTGLVSGLLAGWLGEWVIDWLYWRRRKPAAGDDGALRAQVRSMEGENRELRARLAMAMPQVVEKVVTVERERLEDIYGIGPTYGKRLRANGITNFAELAEQDAEHLRDIMGIKDWQAADPASWISQARDFARRRRDAD